MNRNPELTMLIGLPRSGKTTYRSCRNNVEFVISADEVRKAVYGARFWPPGENLMWAIRDLMLNYALNQPIDLIIDETNLSRNRRIKAIKKAHENGYFVHGLVFTTDADTCIQRAYKTEQEDLVPVIKRMDATKEMPSKDEGFDSLEEVISSKVLGNMSYGYEEMD